MHNARNNIRDLKDSRFIAFWLCYSSEKRRDVLGELDWSRAWKHILHSLDTLNYMDMDLQILLALISLYEVTRRAWGFKLRRQMEIMGTIIWPLSLCTILSFFPSFLCSPKLLWTVLPNKVMSCWTCIPHVHHHNRTYCM